MADNNSPARKTNIAVGDLVWAKVKGFPTWPGIILSKNDPSLVRVKVTAMGKNQHFMKFFGPSKQNISAVSSDSIKDYVQFREKQSKECKQLT